MQLKNHKDYSILDFEFLKFSNYWQFFDSGQILCALTKKYLWIIWIFGFSIRQVLSLLSLQWILSVPKSTIQHQSLLGMGLKRINGLLWRKMLWWSHLRIIFLGTIYKWEINNSKKYFTFANWIINIFPPIKESTLFTKYWSNFSEIRKNKMFVK